MAEKSSIRFDPLTTEERSERMSRVRNKNTKPELLIRRLIWSLGYRFRLHSRQLPGHPDIIFSKRKKVIFVHGCFWHQHQQPECKQYRMPKTRLDFWLPKLESNRLRDLNNQEKLRELGWKFLVIWECQLKDKQELTRRIIDFLEGAS
jgi:DNA mismatch endonuclease (patch repair protein)